MSQRIDDLESNVSKQKQMLSEQAQQISVLQSTLGKVLLELDLLKSKGDANEYPKKH